MANAIRMTGQLIDTLNGNHVWAERFDGMLEDIFAVQEEVTQAWSRHCAADRRLLKSKRVDRKPTICTAYEVPLRAAAHAGGDRQGGSKVIDPCDQGSEAGTRNRSRIASLALNVLANARGTLSACTWPPTGRRRWRETMSGGRTRYRIGRW